MQLTLTFKLTEGQRYSLASHLTQWDKKDPDPEPDFQFVVEDDGYSHIKADGLYLHRDGEWSTFPEEPVRKGGASPEEMSQPT